MVATIGTDATGQAYNINADTVAGAIAEALGAEKLVYLTDIEGLRRDVDDPASLIRQTTPDELDALMADGTIAGGMIPKVESCVQAVRNGVRRAHILDGRIAHVLLLEIFTDDGIGTMVAATEGCMTTPIDSTSTLDHCPFMPVFAPPQIMFVRGSGTELWDDDRQALPRLPRRPRGDLARPRQPGGRRRDRRAGQRRCCTSPTCSPTDVAWRRPHRARPSCSARSPASDGQVFFCNSGAEANEAALKLARKFGGRGRHAVGQRLRQLPRPHARRRWPPPASRPSTSRSSRCPTASATSRCNDLDALDAAVDPIGRRRAARAGAGRGRRDPGRPPSTCAASARCATSAACC